MKVVKPFALITLFWLIIGIILSVKIPEIVEQVKIPNVRGGGYMERKISVYEFPIVFSIYMSFVTYSFSALWLVIADFRNSTKK